MHFFATLLRPLRGRSRRLSAAAAPAFLFLFALAAFAPAANAQSALQFDGTNDYVTFGAAPGLGVSTFTIECWFRRTGTGVTVSTGTGGVTALPLVTKGRGEADGSNLDMNFFLGIRGSDSVLVADYEEGTGQTSPGLNHPIAGVTPLVRNVWYHAAATFDGTTLRIYLNGNLENTVVVGASRLPQSASIQHAGLGTAMTSAGTAAGFFAGVIDEPRVWSVARTQSEIAAALGGPLTSGAGLVGRWGLDENTGTTAANSVAGGAAGTLTNGPVWTPGTTWGAPGAYAVDFTGTNGYVALGNPAALQLSTFTIECWFRRDGAGTSTNSGSGGAMTIPLLAHGRGDQDTGYVHVNWLLGIRETDNVLMADFEEATGSVQAHQNHPVFGVTPIAAGSGWHHAAASYDGTTWNLYLDGNLEATLLVGRPAGNPTVMPASIASALHQDGTPEGFFDGVIDEARVWGYARSLAELQADINAQITGARSGLVARWGFNEGAGTTVASTAGTTLNGTLTGTGWAWVTGAPFDLVITPPSPPAAPTGLAAAGLTTTSIRLTWTDASNNETGFAIERSTSGAGGPFSPLVTTAANVTTWDDTGLTPLGNYCYRVRAVNVHGQSAWTDVACSSTAETNRAALDFAGSTYVGFGDPAALDLAQFTIECWFRRDGAGTTTTTGTGGVTDAIPLVTKGRGESETSNVDLNWFMGLRAADGVLVADFEEGAGGASPSLNHPVAGVTPVAIGSGWHHAAATYDGTTWNLYLDGNLEATLAVGQPCASASTQQAAIASALTSTGTAAGYFDGAVDEVRVWNYARSLAQVRGTANAEIDVATTGLVARWALDEGAGTAIAGSAGTAVPGTITGANYTWIGPAPFDLTFNTPPDLPALVGPADDATGVYVGTPLQVAASDADGDSVTVRFYGRSAAGPPPADFTLIHLPDTQYYTAQLNGGTNAMLKSQLQWIVDNRVARNIGYVVQVGDCVNTASIVAEWMRADTAYATTLEDPVQTTLPDGMPYGICVGNHDQDPNGTPDGASTTLYNQYFGVARFAGRAYYGGHFAELNDNWFDLFTAGGYDFVSIGLEYDTSPDANVLGWADSVLKAYPTRLGIVSSHWLVNTGNPGTFSAQGTATYEALKDNPNLILMLCGHVAGEGRRSDTFEGRTVHSLLADYQSRTAGGNGWLRLLEFSPANNVVRVRTYSPWLNQYEADSDSSSQFTLAVPLGGSTQPYALLGQVKVASGETASLTWPGLLGESAYEWYATTSDGSATRTGPAWGFTTGEAVAPTVAVTSPNGGENLVVGASVNLAWTAGDNVGVTGVDLLLSRAGEGGPFETLASGLPNSGSYAWTVTGPATADARLRVVARDAIGNTAADLSDVAFSISSTTGVGDGPARAFALAPVRPSPMHGRANVAFELPRASHVRLRVMDAQGRVAATLADGMFTAGVHSIAWETAPDASALPSGLYFVTMEVPGRAPIVRRAVLVR